MNIGFRGSGLRIGVKGLWLLINTYIYISLCIHFGPARVPVCVVQAEI